MENISSQTKVVKMKTPSGQIIKTFEGEELEAYRREFQIPNSKVHGHKDVIRMNPGDWTLPTHFEQFADKIYQFKFRESDIIVNSCPRSGDTWVQEIIRMMKNIPDPDNPASKSVQSKFLPNLEMDASIGTEGPYFDIIMDQLKSHIPEGQENEGIFLKLFDTFPNPRLINTQLPLSLLPPNTLDCTKVVYVARNPYDVCVSFYHLCRLFKHFNYSGTFEQFVQRFMEGKMVPLPFWEHVHEAWKSRNHGNLHFIFYENLKHDLYNEIVKLNVFLETGLTEEQLKKVVDFTSFSEMEKRGVTAYGVYDFNMDIKEKEGGFLSKGAVGEWKNYFNQETTEKMKNWVDNKMKDMEIPFIYEIKG